MGANVDIRSKIAEWREQLLDLTKRNRLINCKLGKTGPVAIEHPSLAAIWQRVVTGGEPMWFPHKAELLGREPDVDSLYAAEDDAPAAAQATRSSAAELEQCLRSPKLKTTHLLTSLTDKAIGGKLGRLALAAKTSLSEQGVNTLFLACGLLKWFESKDSEVELYAPLLLIPVRLRRDSADSEWMLAAVEDELVPNHCLAELLRKQFSIKAPEPNEEELLENSASLTKFFAAYRRAIESHSRWEIQPRVLLGAFGFQKVAMWQDLQRNEQKIAGSDLCCAIGGTGASLSHADQSLSPRELDEHTAPEDTFHILDCDSSQQAAVEAIKSGSHLVLDGPPGTGKSQTIANAIAEALARGKTVLFVSEKAAALEVVKRRLDQAGLGDFCLECHSHKANKREVVEKLGQSLRLAPEHFPAQDNQLRDLLRLRSDLNSYVKALHERRLKLNQTVYQVSGHLAAVADAPITRCSLPRPEHIDSAALDELCRVVDAVAKLDGVLFASAHHPWRGCRANTWSMTLEDDVRHHFAVAAAEVNRRRNAVTPLAELGFCEADPTLRKMAEAVASAKMALTLPKVPAAWFAGDTRSVIANYIKLHHLANQFAALRATVPAFSTEAIEAHNRSIVEQIVSKSDWSSRLESHPDLTVRSANRHTAAVATELAATAAAADALAAAITRTTAMLQICEPHHEGAIGANFSIERAGRLSAAASIVAQLGNCRLTWFDAPRRQLLRKSVKQLSDEHVRVTHEREQLNVTFTPGAFEAEAISLLREVRQHESCDRVKRVLPHPSTTVRSVARHFVGLADEIGNTAMAARTLDAGVDRATTLLQMQSGTDAPATPTTIEQTGRLGAALSIIAQLGTCHASWFVPRRRHALQTSAKELAAEHARITNERQQLALSFRPEAFEPRNDSLLTSAAAFDSWTKRLWPSWRRARASLSALFLRPDALGGSRSLLIECRKLQAYREREIAFTKDVLLVAEDLRCEDPHDFNWRSVIGDLARIEQLQALIQIPDALVSLLTVEGGIDRSLVASAAVGLKVAQQALREAATRLQQVYRLDVAAGGRFDSQTSDHLASLLIVDEAILRRRAADLDAVAALAHSGDLPLVSQRQQQPAASLSGGECSANQLHAHLDRVDSLTAAISNVMGDLRTNDRGIDWTGIAADLARIEQLQEILACPESLISSLSADRGLDRNAVADAARDLQSKHHVLLESCAALNKVYRLDSREQDAPRFDAMSCDKLAAFVRSAERALRQRLTSLEAAAALLKDDHDVAIAELEEQFDRLSELRAIRKSVEPLIATTGDRPGPELVKDQWIRHAAAGTAIKRAFERSPWPLPSHFIDVMTKPVVRQRLQECISAAAIAAQPVDDHPSFRFAQAVIPFDEDVSVGITPISLSATQLAQWLSDRSSDAPRLQEWLHLAEASGRMTALGLDVLLEEMRTRRVPSENARRSLLQRFYRQWLDAACSESFVLSRFRWEDHEGTIAKFRDLDRKIISRTYERVREAQLSDTGFRAGDHADAPAASERGILLREMAKKRRHLPLRQLFRQIATLLTKLKPCVMMSPLAVSTFLDSDLLQFDLVIFDEASQVRPHDAIGAIYRGKQLVVAGDQKQLPPTSFFERSGGVVDTAEEGEGEEKEIEQSTRDFESILDVCATLRIPHRQLLWHYRSRRESLIAFSNRHFYDDHLVTFPSARDFDGSSGVRFELVEEGRWQGGAGAGINPIEAQRTADAVIRYAREHPSWSLGVITMNQAQQLLVYDEIEKRKRAHPTLAEFFSENRDEPFFVKNLENVQGDERDVIILTVNYAKNAAGTLSHNFGPLNHAGGERRLNVAVTRAKHELLVVSSITCNDIDLSRTSAKGAALLRTYLDFADRGTTALEREVRENPARDYDSEFEAQVARALEAVGLDVRKQVGCGGFRIDLALVDPQRPGRYVLGIECDGATYHSSANARDRDRLRQEVLESLGWTICRVWSTDWVRDPRRQIAKVLEAYKQARDCPTDLRAATSTSEPERRTPTMNGNGKAAPPPKPEFADIDSVPGDLLDQLLLEVLGQNGATPSEDLTRATARRLGFTRTGNKIAQRLEQRIRNLRRKAIINVDKDGRLFKATTPSKDE